MVKILKEFTVDVIVNVSVEDVHWSSLYVSLSDMETSEKIQGSGILQVFASLLIPQSSCTAKVANVIAEIAKNGEVFLKNFSAGNIFSFTPYLSVCFINLCFHFVD